MRASSIAGRPHERFQRYPYWPPAATKAATTINNARTTTMNNSFISSCLGCLLLLVLLLLYLAFPPLIIPIILIVAIYIYFASPQTREKRPSKKPIEAPQFSERYPTTGGPPCVEPLHQDQALNLIRPYATLPTRHQCWKAKTLEKIHANLHSACLDRRLVRLLIQPRRPSTD